MPEVWSLCACIQPHRPCCLAAAPNVSLAGPAITADNPKAPVRDTWMTDIPEERVATAGPMSVSSFS